MSKPATLTLDRAALVQYLIELNALTVTVAAIKHNGVTNADAKKAEDKLRWVIQQLTNALTV